MMNGELNIIHGLYVFSLKQMYLAMANIAIRISSPTIDIRTEYLDDYG
jgi:hypothetical protein